MCGSQAVGISFEVFTAHWGLLGCNTTWSYGWIPMLEEHAAIFFRVEVCRVRNWFCYTSRLQAVWSLKPLCHFLSPGPGSISLPSPWPPFLQTATSLYHGVYGVCEKGEPTVLCLVIVHHSPVSRGYKRFSIDQMWIFWEFITPRDGIMPCQKI
jgi:hypothetical protein